MMRVSAKTIMIGVVAMLALPGLARACGICVDSLIYSAMPWLSEALLVLLGWLIIDYGIRVAATGKIFPGGFRWSGVHAIIIVSLCLFFLLGFGGIRGTALVVGGFLVLLRARELWASRPPLVKARRAFACMAVALCVGIAAVGGWQRFQMSKFEVFDKLVYSGSTQSRWMSQSFAKDVGFDVARLEPMLASGERERRDKAFDILAHRKNAGDLIRFADLILPLLPSERHPDGLMWEQLYLSIWLQSLGLNKVETRADLEAWLEQAGPAAENGDPPPKE